MHRANEKPVMDVLPWPNGRGFQGATSWWDIVMSKDEHRRLDNLMGLALLDEDVHNRLVHERDESLLAAFGLSYETRAWLQSLEVGSLVELAQAIVAGPKAPAPVAIAP
jgi:hypothetical protein